MMKNTRFALGVGLCGSLLMATAAFAADKRAQDMVADMAKTRDAALQQRPALRLIDTAVRADCAAKGKNEAPDGAFCSCASAVTFSLWLSGMDARMAGRLDAFSQTPDEQAAAEFAAAYQGPELYAPLCQKAT